MKLKRPIARISCIASHCPAGASPGSFSLRLLNRPRCERSETPARRPFRATSIFSGRTSVVSPWMIRKVISKWPANFYLHRWQSLKIRFIAFAAKIRHSAAVKAAEEELRRVILGACFSPSPQRGEGRGEEANFSNPLAPALSPLEQGEGVESQPVLDLIFLGMGEDGHVASLFPDAPAEVVNHPGPFLFIDNSPKPPPRRISLSYAAMVAARQVWVLISGVGKEKALRESLVFSGKTPLARVIQLRHNTRIFSEIRPN